MLYILLRIFLVNKFYPFSNVYTTAVTTATATANTANKKRFRIIYKNQHQDCSNYVSSCCNAKVVLIYIQIYIFNDDVCCRCNLLINGKSFTTILCVLYELYIMFKV